MPCATSDQVTLFQKSFWSLQTCLDNFVEFNKSKSEAVVKIARDISEWVTIFLNKDSQYFESTSRAHNALNTMADGFSIVNIVPMLHNFCGTLNKQSVVTKQYFSDTESMSRFIDMSFDTMASGADLVAEVCEGATFLNNIKVIHVENTLPFLQNLGLGAAAFSSFKDMCNHYVCIDYPNETSFSNDPLKAQKEALGHLNQWILLAQKTSAFVFCSLGLIAIAGSYVMSSTFMLALSTASLATKMGSFFIEENIKQLDRYFAIEII